jgi:hypothetical protein
MLQYKLSATETAGVVGVGVALGLISNQITGRFSGREHLTAMVVSGAALYTLGVVIGTNRPEGGFLAGGYASETPAIDERPPELAGLLA